MRLVELAMMYPPLKYQEAIKMSEEINLSHRMISGYTTNENPRSEKNIGMICYPLSKWKGKACQHIHTHTHTYTHNLIIFFKRSINHNFSQWLLSGKKGNKMEGTELKSQISLNISCFVYLILELWKLYVIISISRMSKIRYHRDPIT